MRSSWRKSMPLEAAVTEARKRDYRRQQAGIDQAALDGAAREGLGNGLFEDQEEDVPTLLEEYFPRPIQNDTTEPQPNSTMGTKRSHLHDRLSALTAQTYTN